MAKAKTPQKFDPLSPFAAKECYDDFLSIFTTLEFKLYGRLQFEVIFKSDLEFDLNAGEVHYTERDLKAISTEIEKFNKKWDTQITYCLFMSKKFPVNILINIRSPRAPFEINV